MWDQRYASDEFVYGTQPKLFLAEHAQILTGPVLSQARLSRNTGGPKDPDILLDAEKLAGEFPGCELLLWRELEHGVIEVSLHTGIFSFSEDTR